jgi:hypothetical protein
MLRPTASLAVYTSPLGVKGIMKNLFLVLISCLMLLGCRNDVAEAENSNMYQDWDLIYLDLDNTSKRYIISSEHDTLTIINYVWQVIEKPDGREVTLRQPDSRMRIKLDRRVKEEIVSNAINIFKNPQPYNLNVTDYVGKDGYIVLNQKDANLTYQFPYKLRNEVKLQHELVKLFQLLEEEEKKHSFQKL